jgi:hypothetical protein
MEAAAPRQHSLSVVLGFLSKPLLLSQHNCLLKAGSLEGGERRKLCKKERVLCWDGSACL